MSKEEQGFYDWLRGKYPDVELNNFQRHAVNFIYGGNDGIYLDPGIAAGKSYLVKLMHEYEESLEKED